MRITPILITLLLGVVPAHAGKRAGVTMPDTTTIANKQLVLNGMGLREATWLKIDVYVAGLYLQQRSADPAKIIAANEVKMIVLRFVRDVGRSDIVKAWSDGFAGNATVPISRIKPLIDRLNSWMPRFNKGDTLAFIYVPGEGVAVEINQVRKGVLTDDDFARSLIAIWLGPKPPTGALQRGMLGK
jgi:hypothetical protein